MEDTVIQLETAKVAKRKKFKLKVHNYYHPQYGLYNDSDKDDFNADSWEDFYYSAPTQTMLQTWLRKKHNVEVWVACMSTTTSKKLKYRFYIVTKSYKSFNSNFDTYEAAMEAGLCEALRSLK